MVKSTSRARMLMRGKVSMHVETCVLLYREDYKSGKKNIKAEVKAEM